MKFSEFIYKFPWINKFIKIIGMDKAIFYSLSSQIWAFISGFVSIFFIINYLNPVEQGYWYTFMSLGALASFAELGFGVIITQFISHEYSNLREENGILVGDQKDINRIISLIKFSIKFYFGVSLVSFCVVSFIGFIFLSSSTNNSLILLSWLFYSFTGALTLFVSIFGAVTQGLNKVATVIKILLIAKIISLLFVWTSLYLGLNLWALTIGGMINIIVMIVILFLHFPDMFKQIFSFKVQGKYNWLKETVPLQWRYAISWVSSYFTFQFFVPIAMFFVGADIAGKVGISFLIIRSLQNVALSWGNTKIPKFNIHVAKGERNELNNFFKKIQLQSIIVYIIGSFSVIFVLIYIFPIINWNTRILPIEDVVLLIVAEGINLIFFNWSYYLRAHKQEPYMIIYFLSSLCTIICVISSYYFFGSTSLALLSLIIVRIIFIIPAWKIFVNKREDYEKGEIGY